MHVQWYEIYLSLRFVAEESEVSDRFVIIFFICSLFSYVFSVTQII